MSRKELRILRDEWGACTKCPIGKLAYRHVFYDTEPKRREIVDILFVGEGPGETEDIDGFPFTGRAGKFLRRVVARANKHNRIVGYTNLLACRPTDSLGGRNRPPKNEEVINCSPRLRRTIELLDPYIIVALGHVPELHLPEIIKPIYGNDTSLIRVLPHPAYLIRNGAEDSSRYAPYLQGMAKIFIDLEECIEIDEAEEEEWRRQQASNGTACIGASTT